MLGPARAFVDTTQLKLEWHLERFLARSREARRRAAVIQKVAEGIPLRPLTEALQERWGRLTAAEKRDVYAWIDERAPADEHDLTYAERSFDGQRQDIEKTLGPIRGRRILEIGPGHTLAGGVLFALHGAARYVAVDLFPIAALDARTYRRLRERVARPPLYPVPDGEQRRAAALRRFDEVVRFVGDVVTFDEATLAYRFPVDAARLPFPDGAFDVVLTCAAFEHFSAPEEAIRECTRVLAPGGVQVHQIDLRDHRDFTRPLDFLRFSEEEWKAQSSDMFCYTNRLRRADFERLFVAAGNELLEVDVNVRGPAPTAAERAAFHPRFRELPDAELEALSARFYARRTAPLPHARAPRPVTAETA
jgi:SAM-dependent methyltransferase